MHKHSLQTNGILSRHNLDDTSKTVEARFAWTDQTALPFSNTSIFVQFWYLPITSRHTVIFNRVCSINAVKGCHVSKVSSSLFVWTIFKYSSFCPTASPAGYLSLITCSDSFTRSYQEKLSMADKIHPVCCARMCIFPSCVLTLSQLYVSIIKTDKCKEKQFFKGGFIVCICHYMYTFT